MQKILIIEDEAPVRVNLTELLEHEGFEVLSAGDGLAGVQLALASLPDLILCDVMLPSLDGYAVVQELRRDPRTLTVPFIFLTALGDRGHVRQGMNLGADDYIAKPFTRAEVLEAVASRLKRKSVVERLHSVELQQAEAKWLLYDSITYLPNRMSLRDRVAGALSATPAGATAIVLSLSIDRFDRIPLTLGAARADQLLKQVADRLLAGAPSAAIITRLRSAVFALVLPASTPAIEPATLARQIADLLSLPFQVGEHEIFVTLSQGSALYPHDGDQIELLTTQAELARVQAERAGGDCWHAYQPQLSQIQAADLALEAELNRAIERGELRVYYQPRLDLRSGQVVGAEALVRWQHPTRALVPPLTFIPLAEASGVIHTLGLWVLGEVCRQIKAWQAAGLPELQISVNLSARQLEHPNLAERFTAMLDAHQLAPRWLEVELTESQIMRNAGPATLALRALREGGLRVALDDFGTGYSSLGHLRRLPVDTLKIDRVFIHDTVGDTNAQALLEEIVQLAHRLGLRVVAEGVETEAQYELLRQCDCDEIQGFWLCRPLPAADFEHFLRARAMPAPPAR